MKYNILILLGMIFCHIVDDYYLQGWLASAKQRDWWKTNAPNPLYKHDYIMALFMHSFSWSFSILLLPTLCKVLLNTEFNIGIYLMLFIENVILHMVVDDLKANKKKINLVQDQSFHLGQIIGSWVIFNHI